MIENSSIRNLPDGQAACGGTTFQVIKTTPRRDGKYLIMLLKGGSAISDVQVEVGKRVIVRDGVVVEVCS